jgi:selenocysteine lyase/cysteine desulfurase
MVKKTFSNDCYVKNEDLFMKYRSFKTRRGEVIDLNHASLTRPYKDVFEAVDLGEEIPALKARVVAASLVNLKDPSRVIFGRNTTEALSFTYWLANVNRGNVVVSNAENESVARVYREHRDHGNTNKKDGWSTFPDEIIAEKYKGFEEKVETGVTVKIVPLLEKGNIQTIVDSVDDNTTLVVVSHVIRNNGKIIDVKELARKIKGKNSNTFIAIDGAQALGNLEAIAFEDLERSGVDFYVATPHKTLGSYPIGILYISERAKRDITLLRNKKPVEQVLMKGMIPEVYSIKPNISSEFNKKRFTSLVVASRTLEKGGFKEGNNFLNKIRYIKNLKEYFIHSLKHYDVEIISLGESYSSAILAFRFNDRDNAKTTLNLQEKGIFSSYISDTANIRVSFDITNTKEDIDLYFERLSQLNFKI